MNDLNKQKLEMWTKKMDDLENEKAGIAKRKGEAAAMGDLSENAAYKMAVEDLETNQVRIDEIKNILRKIEEDK